MRALRFHDFGLEHLRLEDVPVPQPGPGEVLIRIQAASITPGDVKNVQGGTRGAVTLPRIPGRNFAGVVDRGSPDCEGQEVWGTGGDLGVLRDGTHAEYVVVPSDAVIPKPKNITIQQAGSLGNSLVTAWAALFDRAQLKKRETLLVIGSNGQVGRAAVQLGNWAGARVIGVSRNADNRSGADVVISSSAPSFPDDLKSALGPGADVVLDTVSGPMFDTSLAALRPGGRMVAITVSGGTRESFDLLQFYRNDLRLYGLNTFRLDARGSGVILQELVRPIELGWITAQEVTACPLSSAVERYRSMSNAGEACVLTMAA